MIDSNKLGIIVGVELSFLKKEEQLIVYELLSKTDKKLTVEQAECLKRDSQDGKFDIAILEGSTISKKKSKGLKLKAKWRAEFFDDNDSDEEIEKVMKHEEYEFKLCADQLTKKSMLKAFHPELQEYLMQKGIQATVYYPKSGNGTLIGLSVSQLKDITEKTGIRLESTITTDRLSEILLGNTEKTHWGHAPEWGNYDT